MMMMIAPNSLARQNEGVHWEGKEETGNQRKKGQTETMTSGADAPTLSVRDVRYEEYE